MSCQWSGDPENQQSSAYQSDSFFWLSSRVKILEVKYYLLTEFHAYAQLLAKQRTMCAYSFYTEREFKMNTHKI